MRNPKLEVFEAGKVVLEYADADFVSDALKQIHLPTFKVEYLYNRLTWGHLHNNGKKVPTALLGLPGFTSANTVYDERLVAEWSEFLSTVLTHEITITARTNKLAHDHHLGVDT